MRRWVPGGGRRCARMLGAVRPPSRYVPGPRHLEPRAGAHLFLVYGCQRFAFACHPHLPGSVLGRWGPWGAIRLVGALPVPPPRQRCPRDKARTRCARGAQHGVRVVGGACNG